MVRIASPPGEKENGLMVLMGLSLVTSDGDRGDVPLRLGSDNAVRVLSLQREQSRHVLIIALDREGAMGVR
jgi:hypothetical protein